DASAACPRVVWRSPRAGTNVTSPGAATGSPGRSAGVVAGRPGSRQAITEPRRVADGIAVEVVVEVRVDVVTVLQPCGEAFGRGPEPASGVAPDVATLVGGRSVEADVRPVRGQQPRVLRQHVVQAQRGAVAAQRLVDVVVEPRLLADLHRPPQCSRPEPAGRGREELVEALDVATP